MTLRPLLLASIFVAGIGLLPSRTDSVPLAGRRLRRLGRLQRRRTGRLLGLGSDGNQGIAGHVSKLSDEWDVKQARQKNMPFNERILRSSAPSARSPLAPPPT